MTPPVDAAITRPLTTLTHTSQLQGRPRKSDVKATQKGRQNDQGGEQGVSRFKTGTLRYAFGKKINRN